MRTPFLLRCENVNSRLYWMGRSPNSLARLCPCKHGRNSRFLSSLHFVQDDVFKTGRGCR